LPTTAPGRKRSSELCSWPGYSVRTAPRCVAADKREYEEDRCCEPSPRLSGVGRYMPIATPLTTRIAHRPANWTDPTQGSSLQIKGVPRARRCLRAPQHSRDKLTGESPEESRANIFLRVSDFHRADTNGICDSRPATVRPLGHTPPVTICRILLSNFEVMSKRETRRDVLALTGVGVVPHPVFGQQPENRSTDAPDLVVLNAKVTTVDPRQRRADAFAIKSGRIQAVGSSANIATSSGRQWQLGMPKGATLLYEVLVGNPFEVEFVNAGTRA
jgi:hypothetical protein